MNILVILSPKIPLEQALKEAGIEDPTTVTQMTIAGTITEDDLRFLGISSLLCSDFYSYTTIGNKNRERCFWERLSERLGASRQPCVQNRKGKN